MLMTAKLKDSVTPDVSNMEKVIFNTMKLAHEDFSNDYKPKFYINWSNESGQYTTAPCTQEVWKYVKKEHSWNVFDRKFIAYRDDNGFVHQLDSFLYDDFNRTSVPLERSKMDLLIFKRHRDDSIHLMERPLKIHDNSVVNLIQDLRKIERWDEIEGGQVFRSQFAVHGYKKELGGDTLSLEKLV